jgi:hypothetical protein
MYVRRATDELSRELSRHLRCVESSDGAYVLPLISRVAGLSRSRRDAARMKQQPGFISTSCTMEMVEVAYSSTTRYGERFLERNFHDQYSSYKGTVRRW